MLTKIRGAMLSNLLVFICLVAIVLVIGMRDVSVGTDTVNYVRNYYRVRDCACLEGGFEPGFQILTFLVASTGVSSATYLSILAALLVLLVWLFLNNMSQMFDYSNVIVWKTRLATLIFILISPFFFNASVNVLRNGLSAFFLLNTATFFLRNQWSRVILFGLLAVLFHRTALLYLPLVTVLNVINTERRRRVFCIVLLGLAAAYSVGLSEEIVKVLSKLTGIDVHGMFANYAAHVTYYRRGVRWDFLLFSLGWFIGGIVANRSFISMLHRPVYEKMVDLYGLFLVPFLLFGWGNYSDRLLLVPWQLIPVIVSGALVLGRIRIRSHGSVYLLGLLGATIVFVVSVIHNEAFIRWLLERVTNFGVSFLLGLNLLSMFGKSISQGNDIRSLIYGDELHRFGSGQR